MWIEWYNRLHNITATMAAKNGALTEKQYELIAIELRRIADDISHNDKTQRQPAGQRGGS